MVTARLVAASKLSFLPGLRPQCVPSVDMLSAKISRVSEH